ncbi:response regulator [Gloeothece verrucosa]|nr:response regulator transcription factor [Gloeothece verrucosa]
MSQPNVIRILIADDHPIFRLALKKLLECERDITVVAQAEDGREALTLFAQHRPDVTLMDLRMPIMEGADAIAAIRAKFKQARIIVFSTYDGDENIYRGLRSGAKGYIFKGAEPHELLKAIRTVHKGQKYIPPNIAAKLAERLGSSPLSNRELEVLRLIAKGKSNSEISQDLSIAESTVRFHLKNIFSKLDVGDRTQALVTALNRGIVRL